MKKGIRAKQAVLAKPAKPAKTAKPAKQAWEATVQKAGKRAEKTVSPKPLQAVWKVVSGKTGSTGGRRSGKRKKSWEVRMTKKIDRMVLGIYAGIIAAATVKEIRRKTSL